MRTQRHNTLQYEANYRLLFCNHTPSHAHEKIHTTRMPHNLYCCWDKMLHVTSKISKYCKIICIFLLIFGILYLEQRVWRPKTTHKKQSDLTGPRTEEWWFESACNRLQSNSVEIVQMKSVFHNKLWCAKRQNFCWVLVMFTRFSSSSLNHHQCPISSTFYKYAPPTALTGLKRMTHLL